MYDTETAEEIGSYYYGNPSDFEHVSESLYRAKKGAWFTAGSGGPRSHYARSVGQNETQGGEGIRVLTKGEALQWCETHDIDADTIAKHFTVVEA